MSGLRRWLRGIRRVGWMHDALDDLAARQPSIEAGMAEASARQRADAARADASIEGLRTGIATVTPTIASLQAAVDEQAALREAQGAASAAALGDVAAALAILREQVDAHASVLRARGGSGPGGPFPALPRAGDAASEDWFHESFSETFRGTPEQIRERLAIYLPDIDAALARVGPLAVLDLGAGRGDWLALLRDHGVAAIGFDTNARLVARAVADGLDVRLDDAGSALAAQPAASAAAITAIHLVEHLPLPRLVSLLVESARVLAPGGVLVLETPDPENVAVGACSFYLDPTHERPIPAALLQFLAAAAGLDVQDVRRLHPDDATLARARDEQWPAGLAALFGGPRDYAVLARPAAMSA
jgi:SAM-dependent methyltransferase